MATPPRTPVVIEFNGLPGTGKTSIVKVMEALLTQKGISYCKTYQRYGWQARAVSLVVAWWLIPLFVRLRKFAKPFAQGKSKIWYMAGMMSLCRSYRNFKKNTAYEFLIHDQGIIQDIISIAHKDAFTQREDIRPILQWLNSHHIEFVRIDCRCDEHLSLARIASRPTNASRLDNMSQEEQLETLRTQKKNFEFIRTMLDEEFPPQRVIEIDTAAKPEENAQRIIEYITNL